MTTLLVDGHFMLHRMCFIRELRDLRAGGRHTGPTFGFLRVLRASLNKFKPDSCIVVWDSGGSKYRKELYPEYKAHREDKPKNEALDHIHEQKGDVQNILPYLSVKQLIIDGYEGDDLLAFLCRELADEFVYGNESAIIITEDKDLLQLVGCGVAVYRPISNQMVTEDNFEEITGLEPGRCFFSLRKAITGDTSDNINGVRGVGEKTATKLLREFFYDENEEDWKLPWKNAIGDFKKFCAEHRTKTAKRIAEEWKTVERNLKLVDLWEITYTATLESKVRPVVKANAPTVPDIELMRKLHEFEFFSFIQSFADWITPFRRLKKISASRS